MIRGDRRIVKNLSHLKSRTRVLNRGKMVKQLTLTGIVFLLTVSIMLVMPTITATTINSSNLPTKATTVERGIIKNGSGEIEWDKTYGGTDTDVGQCAERTADGGYIITGYTTSYGAGSLDFWLIKTDENGNHQWNQTFGGIHGDWAYCVKQTADGGYIIVGFSDSFGAGTNDVWLIKTDENGDHLWNKTYGGTVQDEGRCVLQATDEGYIIVGFTESFDAGSYHIWLIKTDENGNHQWNQTYGGGQGSYFAYWVERTNDGGYIITGWTLGGTLLIKTDENGGEEWRKIYVETDTEYAYCVKQTSDEGYIITGNRWSYDTYQNDVLLIKADENGNLMWKKTYGGTGEHQHDYGYGVVQTADGGYLITGYTKSYGVVGSSDVWLIKTDENGDHLWNKTYGGTGSDHGYCVAPTSDGGYIIAGKTSSYGAGDSDVWLIKVSVFDDSVDEIRLFNIDVAIYVTFIVSVLVVALLSKSLGHKMTNRNKKL